MVIKSGDDIPEDYEFIGNLPFTLPTNEGDKLHTLFGDADLVNKLPLAERKDLYHNTMDDEGYDNRPVDEDPNAPDFRKGQLLRIKIRVPTFTDPALRKGIHHGSGPLNGERIPVTINIWTLCRGSTAPTPARNWRIRTYKYEGPDPTSNYDFYPIQSVTTIASGAGGVQCPLMLPDYNYTFQPPEEPTGGIHAHITVLELVSDPGGIYLPDLPMVVHAFTCGDYPPDPEDLP